MKSDKNGEWAQIGLISGQYILTVEKEGVGTSKRTVQVRNNARNSYPVVLGGSGRADSDDPKIAAMGKAFDEGVAASAAGKQDEAIAKFEAAIAIIPACADCYYNIGLAQSEKKDYDKAEAAYKKAIEINPKLAEAYTSLAKDLQRAAEVRSRGRGQRQGNRDQRGGARQRVAARVPTRSTTRASSSGTQARSRMRRSSSRQPLRRSRIMPTRTTSSRWRWSTRATSKARPPNSTRT